MRKHRCEVYTAGFEGATLRGVYVFNSLLAIVDVAENEGDFIPIAKASPKQVVAAQRSTAELMEELGVPSDEDIDRKLNAATAREAFTAINFNPSDEQQKLQLLELKTPVEVQRLSALISQYDHDFITQVRELRNYTLSAIIKETEHPDAKVRLAALKMLGNVTEVAMFTERMEIKKIEVSSTELEDRIREKLQKLMPTPVNIEPEPDIIDVADKTPNPLAQPPAL